MSTYARDVGCTWKFWADMLGGTRKNPGSPGHRTTTEDPALWEHLERVVRKHADAKVKSPDSFPTMERILYDDLVEQGWLIRQPNGDVGYTLAGERLAHKIYRDLFPF